MATPIAKSLVEGASGSFGQSMVNQWQHPPSFYCPISQQCMRDPVVLSDGHSYERQYIQRWLRDHSTSPVSGLRLDQKDVFPNHALRNAIEEYFHQVFSAYRKAIRKGMGGALADGDTAPSVSLVRAIDALMQCSLLVNADMDVESVLRKIMEEAKALLGAEAASVFLLDEERRELYSTVNSAGRELRLPVSVGIAGSVARSGEPLIIPSAYDDGRFDRTVDARTGFRTRNILCVPLKDRKGGIIGVAQLVNKVALGTTAPEPTFCLDGPSTSAAEEVLHADSFTADDLQFLMVFASQAAMAIVSSGAFAVPHSRAVGTPEAPQPLDFDKPSTGLKSCEEGLLPKHPACECKERSAVANALLNRAFSDWEFDALALAEVTGNKPLSTLGVYLFDRLSLVAELNLNREKLRSYLEEVESGYSDSNPYHNRAHAASVLHAMHMALEQGGLMAAVLPAFAGQDGCKGAADDSAMGGAAFGRMACLLAAAVHDYEHEGLNNDFLVKSSHERAIRYNDQHVNEQHHVAAAFALLLRPEFNFLDHLPAQDFRRVRGLAIDLVLGTDMAQHGKILEAAGEVLAPCSGAEAAAAPQSRHHAVVLLQLALKCSDLGHLALPWVRHLHWVERLEEEFFQQGDKEQEAGLPVSFLMDRTKPGASASQVGFFDHVVLPLFRTLARAAPRAGSLLAAVEANYAHWKRLESAGSAGQERQAAPAPSAPPACRERVQLTGQRARDAPAATLLLPPIEPARAPRRLSSRRLGPPPAHDAARLPHWEGEAVEASDHALPGAPSDGVATGPVGEARKRRSGRARQRAAKFWATIRRPTPSPSPDPYRL